MHVNFTSSSQSNQSAADTNGCADHLISTKQRKSKHATVQLSFTFSNNFSQTYFHMPQTQGYLIYAKKAAFTACNFTTSSHSSQYDFSMHGLILGPFKFHERKENQNTRYNAFEPYLFIQFQSKPAFSACKLHYFITL